MSFSSDVALLYEIRDFLHSTYSKGFHAKPVVIDGEDFLCHIITFYQLIKKVQQ